MVHSTNRGKVSFWGGILTMVVTLGATFTLFTGHAAAWRPKNNPGKPFKQLETKLDSMESKIDALPSTTAVDALESKIDALPDNTDAINALEGKLDAVESKLDSIEVRMDELLEQCAGGEEPPPGPGTEKIVFLTSQTFRGAFGGLAGADVICQSLASWVGLPGHYKAWLSDSTTSAADRLTQADVPYSLVDGTIVAAHWQDLTDGELMHAIDHDENGDVIDSQIGVWTNTREDGSVWGTDDSCEDWTNPGGTYGRVGDNTAVSFSWTNGGSTACDNEKNIYCFQQ